MKFGFLTIQPPWLLVIYRIVYRQLSADTKLRNYKIKPSDLTSYDYYFNIRGNLSVIQCFFSMAKNQF